MLFRYDDAIRQAMETIKDRDGASFHEQLRRALMAWLASKGAPPTPRDRHRALVARATRLTEELTAAVITDRNNPEGGDDSGEGEG